MSDQTFTDQPIEKEEQDAFGFIGYASVLANRVLQAKPPLTIGIYGSWGSGKSSLMKLLNLEIKRRKPSVSSIEINVWALSNQEEVWHAFLQALFNEVSRKLKWYKKINWGKFIRQLAENVYKILVAIVPVIVAGFLGAGGKSWNWDFVIKTLLLENTNLVGGGSALIGYGLGLYFVLKPAIVEARNAVNFDVKNTLRYKSYEAQITELMQLQNRFKELVKTLVEQEVEQDGLLVVFIDDLDRCTPDKIPGVIEAIKLFTTTEHCVYVLGLDYDMVRQGIARRYKFGDNNDTEDGEEAAANYLEKIVQIPFHLPPIETGYVEDFIAKVYKDDVVSICPNAPEIFSLGLEPNPRTIKRAINIYRTFWDLAVDRWQYWEMKERANPELLAKMIVIQNRYRPLFDHLKKIPKDLVRLQHESTPDNPEWDDLIQELSFKWREDPRPPEEKLIRGLTTFLNIGSSDFTEENVATYIYMTALEEESSGSAKFKPAREERVALLGGDPPRILTMVENIKERGEEQVALFVERLEAAVFDTERNKVEERLSADLALDFFAEVERLPFEPKMIKIPAGPFLMGSLEVPEDFNEKTEEEKMEILAAQFAQFKEGKGVYDIAAKSNEFPLHTVELPDYYTGRYPITNYEYKFFVDETRRKAPSHWRRRNIPEGFEHHPVVNVSWYDAVAYCDWLSKRAGKLYRLPSEAEWEKAARGTDGRIYPWGNNWNPAYLNSSEAARRGTSEVGSYSRGAGPFSLLDVSGNVWEWTRTIWNDKYGYPYQSDDGREDMTEVSTRVVRGGSFNFNWVLARCAYRSRQDPLDWNDYFGFRIVVSPILPSS